MFTRISLTRLYVGSIYKLVFVGLIFSLVPLGLVFGLLAAFGANTVSWNGAAVHGIAGFLLGPLLGGLFAVSLTAFLGSACVLGLWLFSKLKPMSLWAKNLTHFPDEAA
ncbi:hypothetical protein [Caenimonas sp. SL110]|uniref:hypothetical protein n=1 Tax=Caenimonas sp. SL110 TaxID=1450524 RepID=UPI0009E42689|nr:hypothetical protein [Caenimonas sp. SL110]